MTASIPARFRGRARRDAAAFYLSQLARGLLGGEIGVRAGDRELGLAVWEFADLDVEVKQGKRATQVTVKLRWPSRAGRDATFTGASRSCNASERRSGP